MSNIKTIFICVVLLAATVVNAQTETSRFELTPFAGITFGGEFELLHHRNEMHVTPGGVEQMYLYCHFQRRKPAPPG